MNQRQAEAAIAAAARVAEDVVDCIVLDMAQAIEDNGAGGAADDGLPVAVVEALAWDMVGATVRALTEQAYRAAAPPPPPSV